MFLSLFRSEVNAIARKLYLRGISTAISAFAESTSMFFLILTYVMLGNVLEASIVYSVAQYFGMIKTMMTVFYPLAVSSWAEAKVSIQRIEVRTRAFRFMLYFISQAAYKFLYLQMFY